MPNFLGTSKSFTKEFAGPITKGQLPGASASSIADGMAKLKTLHQQVLPFILRREKEAVLPDLPPKQLSTIFVPMSELQEKIYKSFCSRTEVIKSLDTFRRAVEESQSAGDSRLSVNAEVLKSLLFLRLLCTHPSLVLPESIDVVRLDASGKLLALAELLAEAGIFTSPPSAADGDRSALYYEDDTDEPDSYTKVMDSQESVVGSVSIFGAPRNGSKTIRSKCLIFSQFTKSLNVVEDCLFKTLMPSLRYLRLDGSVSADRRVEIAEAFNRDENISVLLLTTRVGGLGLNLTGADVVIFLESDYNPFADLQAMDRAHRIGQSRTVNVYRIITKESIEEKILALQEKKVATSNAIVNTDNSRVYSMGTDRLLDIFTFRNDQDGRQEEDANIDYDLDGLVERCAEDYTSLSVDEFMRSFEQVC
jgi:TATA-binding protein-associated factor